jgi:small subunit ribosomal protein S10
MNKRVIELNIHLKSYHNYYLNRFILATLEEGKKYYGTNFTQIFLPKKQEHFTVLRSPHVDKKARDQFIRITYNRLLKCQIIYEGSSSYLKIFRLLSVLKRINVGVSLAFKLKVTN